MKKYIFILLTALFLLSACDEEILDKQPLDIISSSVVWDDPALVQAYIANLYNSIPFLHIGNMVTVTSATRWDIPMLETLTDQAGGTRFNRNPAKRKMGNTNETGGLIEMWIYGPIRKMNEFYESVGNSAISQEQKNLYIGSVKFVEAFTYFEMAKRYGAIPIITKAQQIDDPEEELYPSRTPELEVYDYALGLLDEIQQQELLSKTASDNGYPSMGAVLALKSRLCLYAASIARFSTVQLDGLLGVPQGEESRFWQASFDASNELINEYSYSLYEKYPDNLSNRFYRMAIDKDNSERIFVRNYDGLNIGHSYDFFMSPVGISPMWAGYAAAPYLDFVESFEKIDGSSGEMPREWETNQTLLSLDDLFGDYDPRMSGAIIHEGTVHHGQEINFYQGLRLPDGTILTGKNDTYNGVPAWGAARKVNPGTRINPGFCVRKYLDEDFTDPLANLSSTDKIIFRLGEIYLNRAEAAFYLNNTTQALTDVNTIRERAGMPLRTSIDEDKIRYERMAELCFEDGARYWDLIRWRTAVESITKVFSGLKMIKDYESGNYLVEFVKYTGSAAPYYSSFSPKHYYKPITPNRIANNPNLAPENPGY